MATRSYVKDKRVNVPIDGHEYARDSFSIHTEERGNGWGFRIRSNSFYMIYCMGGFREEDIALMHASEYIDFLKGSINFTGMKRKDSEPASLPALPGVTNGKRKVRA
jgi:hypothetical protein